MTPIKANRRDLIAATGLVILLKFDPNHWFFSPCDLEIWCMTSKNKRAPLLYYIKLCASFQIHWWIETEVTVQKRSIWVKIRNFLSRVTLKFEGWPWKTIGRLFYVASSFVHHFTANSESKLELQSGNTQSGSNSTIFRAVRPWNLTDDLENNGAPLLCYFKLCASFHTHWWILIWVTVLKHSIRVKVDFFSRVTQIFYGWPSKPIGHLFYATSSFVYHFVPIGEFKLELQYGNAQFGSNSTIFRAVRPWNLTDDLEKQKGTSPMLLQALCSILYPLVNSNWSYSPETPNLGEIWRFLELCDLEIWQMTFKNNRAPLLCYLKLCAAFYSHWWIQPGVSVQKSPIWVKFVDF